MALVNSTVNTRMVNNFFRAFYKDTKSNKTLDTKIVRNFTALRLIGYDNR